MDLKLRSHLETDNASFPKKGNSSHIVRLFRPEPPDGPSCSSEIKGNGSTIASNTTP